MSNESDEELRKAFRTLHSPDRPVYQIGHARRSNKSEEYSSGSILAAGARLLSHSVKAAHGVIDSFAKHAKKTP